MMLMLELAIAGSCWIGRLVPHAFKFYFESHNVLHTPTENCSTCQHSAQIDFSGICWFLCRDRDGKVTPEEVAAAANYLKDTIGTDGVQELISNLPKDKGAYIQHYCLSYWWKGYGISYVLLYRLAFFFYALQRGISLWKTLWNWHHKQRKTMNMKKCHDDVNSRHILGCQNSAVNSFPRELTQWAQRQFHW